MKLILSLILMLLFGLTGFSGNDESTIYFAFDKAVLNAKSRSVIKALLPQMTNQTIILKGYTDSIGNIPYNDALSRRRVEAVRRYIIKQGIAPENILESKGYGELTTFKYRWENRRVDIIISGDAKQNLKQSISNLKVGETVTVKNLEFIPGRHFLQPYSTETLKELLAIMLDNPTLKIEIQGHICCNFSGEDGKDKDTGKNELSANRAKFIYDYLVKNGVDKERLRHKGYARTRPLVPVERTAEDQQRNRRVEVLILER